MRRFTRNCWNPLHPVRLGPMSCQGFAIVCRRILSWHDEIIERVVRQMKRVVIRKEELRFVGGVVAPNHRRLPGRVTSCHATQSTVRVNVSLLSPPSHDVKPKSPCSSLSHATLICVFAMSVVTAPWQFRALIAAGGGLRANLLPNRATLGVVAQADASLFWVQSC